MSAEIDDIIGAKKDETGTTQLPSLYTPDLRNIEKPGVIQDDIEDEVTKELEARIASKDEDKTMIDI